MFCSFVFCSLCFGNLVVFGNSDAVTVVQVTEGDTVTLQTNVTQLLEKHLITWTFGYPESRIAEINKEAGNFSTYDDVPDGRFRNRLKLDHQTGSLNITNSRTKDSGLYEVTIKSKTENTYNFSVTVYTRLAAPVISSSSSECSSLSICSLECSSEIVGHGSLSWYKENDLWSGVNLSDLSSNISLPLVVHYWDKHKHSYSCVLRNPISSQTRYLNFTQLCGACAVATSGGHAHCCDSTEAVLRLVFTALMGVASLTAIVGQ
ncbi:hypothetical protein QQF64_024121 [Cirrhinus molitorella]|uniref:Immunoglobulin domain-containing protein n=1 Tax=Cirrhinus molitorella TaxID=172907 RepID=A0ABR3NL95_9TELE